MHIICRHPGVSTYRRVFKKKGANPAFVDCLAGAWYYSLFPFSGSLTAFICPKR